MRCEKANIVLGRYRQLLVAQNLNGTEGWNFEATNTPLTWVRGTWCILGCKGNATVLVQLLPLKNYLRRNQPEQANLRDPCSRPQVTKDQK